MKKEKQEKKVFTVLIVCIVVMALIFGWMSKDLGGSNQYIDKNSKQSLSELMEQMERAYRNRLEITYEQIDSIEKYIMTDTNESNSTLGNVEEIKLSEEEINTFIKISDKLINNIKEDL